MKRIIITKLLLLLFVVAGYAQETVITGIVTGADTGEPLIGASVKEQGTTNGVITDLDGSFTLTVPQDATIVVSYLGYNNKVVSAGSDFSNITLESDAFGIDEVVVTGVGIGTETKKLGFVVEQVSGKELEEVPASNPANALRAKAPGITIVQASGNPSSGTNIRLRGATSINGSAEPLIIVDGIITNGDLRDINMEDVESIEVIKGAAASSLYGSRAGNGAVQIITKRGRGLSGPQFTVRAEGGLTNLANDYPVATKHQYLLDENGQFVLQGGQWTLDPDGLFDNDFPQYFDNQGAYLKNRSFNSLYASFANTGGNGGTNFHFSAQRLTNEGIIEGLDPYARNNFRGNVDVFATDQLTFRFSASYATTDGVGVAETGQGSNNYFYSGLIASPFYDITEQDADGNYLSRPRGYEITGNSNVGNPLYEVNIRDFGSDRRRLLGRAEIEYDVNDWLTLKGSQSIDGDNGNSFSYVPPGYNSPNPGSGIEDGQLSRRQYTDNYATTEFNAIVRKDINSDLNFTGIGRYVYEDRQSNSTSLSATDFVADIQAVDFADRESYSIGDGASQFQAKAYIGNAIFDWKEKVILDGLFRQESYSQNGPDQLWNPYFRVSAAYLLHEDVSIPGVDFVKLRAAYGTAGNRPAYSYIYNRSTASSTGVEPTSSGNPNLKTSTTADFEVGATVNFLDRFSLTGTYIESGTENDFLFQRYSPTSGSPWSGQWLNLGQIETTGVELALQADLLRKENMDWTLGVAWDTEETFITDLGSVAPFTAGGGGSSAVFRYEEGVQLGTMYGNVLLSNLSQLQVDDNGDVMNGYGYSYGGGGNTRPEDYEVNSVGHVVLKNTHGTSAEQPLKLVNEEGAALITSIGNTVPDFKMGFSSTFQWNNFSVYGVADWKSGGELYNYTKRLMYFQDRHKDQEDYAAMGYHNDYLNASSKIYDAANDIPNSHFVEDASFLKIRELALGYTLGGDKLGSFGNKLDEIKFNLSGRNLLTITDYTGWDPEVALGSNSTYFVYDEFTYPNFRTFTGTIQLKF